MLSTYSFQTFIDLLLIVANAKINNTSQDLSHDISIFYVYKYLICRQCYVYLYALVIM